MRSPKLVPFSASPSSIVSRISPWTLPCISPWIAAGLFFCVFGALFLVDVHRLRTGRLGDFHHFYYASQAMLAGQDPYSSFTGEYRYPPMIACLYLAVAKLPEVAAAIVMLGFNTCCAAGGILIAARECLQRVPRLRVTIGGLAPDAAAVFVVATLAALANGDKLRGELQMVQTNALMFLMFAISLACIDRKPWISGLALAVVFNVKFLSAAFFPYLLIRRRFVAAFSMLMNSALLLFLPLPLVGWRTNVEYIVKSFSGIARISGVMSVESTRARFESIDAPFSCSLTSSFARFASAINVDERLAWVGVLIVLLMFCAFVFSQYRRLPVRLIRWPEAEGQRALPYSWLIALEWSLIIALSVMCSPQSNTRHLFLATSLTTVIVSMLVTRDLSQRTDLWILMTGLVTLTLGFSMPPSQRLTVTAKWANASLQAGVAAWGLLIACVASTGATMNALVSRRVDVKACSSTDRI